MGAATPTPGQLTEANSILQMMQLMLVSMGKDERRNSPAFKELMGSYKMLGTDLHAARGKAQEQQQQQRQLKAQQEQQQQMARLQQAGRLNQPRAAYKPPQAVAGQSLLTKVRQLQEERGIQPVSPAAVPPRAVAGAYGRPAAPAIRQATAAATAEDAAGAMLRARVAYRPPQVKAGGAMVSKLQELNDAHPEAVVEAASLPAPAAATPEAAPLVPPRPLDNLPDGFPLAMPKFTSTLGLASSRAVSNGPEVSRLQELLGALDLEAPLTGEYDARTFRAVSDFQKLRCIPVNGTVGLETRKLLNELVTG